MNTNCIKNGLKIDGLQKMLNICSDYGLEYDMIFNNKTTVCIAFGENIDVNSLPSITLFKATTWGGVNSSHR